MDTKKLSEEISPMQSPEEVKFMFDILEEIKPKKILEIGTGCGAFTTLLATYGSVVTVDKKEAGPDGKHNWDSLYESGKISEEVVDRIKFVLGDSTDQKIVEKVKDKYDLVVIDGAHENKIGWQDWDNYAPMAPVVAMHDIADYEEKSKWCVCFPSTCWANLKRGPRRTMEITPEAGGWGVIWLI